MSRTFAKPPPLGQIVQRQQAAARGAVMAGAEGERGLDLDAQRVDRHRGAVMRAVHDEAAGAHRLEAGEALRHPVGLRQRLEGQRRRRVLARRHPHQRAHRRLVGRLAEIDRHLPAAAVALEGGAGGVVGIERFVQRAGQRARGFLVAGEAGDHGVHGGFLARAPIRVAGGFFARA